MMSLFWTPARWHRPTLEVVGMVGGFTGEGIKTVIPRHAMAKLSCRLVPHQTPADILEKVREICSAATKHKLLVTSLHARTGPSRG